MAFLQVCLLCVCLLKLGTGFQTERFLSDVQWTVKDGLGHLSEAITAAVPGQVHLDLIRAGIIEEPYVGWNDWLYQWVGYSNWTYTGKIDVTAEDLQKNRKLYLKFYGLDTIATIWFQGKILGHADNYHRRYMFDITDVAVVGVNSIQVDFRSAANYSYEQAAAYPYDLYTDIQGVFFNKSQRGFVRKTQCDFGWDWGPGLVPCGIWGNVSLVTFDQVYITDVVPKAYFDEMEKMYMVSVTVCVMVTSEPSSAMLVSVYSQLKGLDNMTVEGEFYVSAEGETCASVVSKPISPEVIEPDHLWWPLGVRWPPTKGRANLTEITSKVDIMMGTENKLASITVTKNIGFRNVQLVQDSIGINKTGLTFYFQLTTASSKISPQFYPFYAKGSNFIPMNAFINRVTIDYARQLLTSFVDGNQNMLRVWGGGLYQPDWFYDLCDEMGIMVWQEFMFADALYPRNGEFLVNVEAEIRDVVRRLGHHPSIVLWSGNNENQGILGLDTVRIVDYTVLYDEIIRTTLWEEDTTRIYWPSSPSNGVLVDDKERELFIQRWGDVSNTSFGDVHRYDYFDYCMDVSKFPKARFVSEFGFQSYPSFSSLKKVSQPQDWSNDSPFMVHRNHHPTGNKQMENLIVMTFNLPVNDNSQYKFMDFIYLSQVMQGLCIRAQAEHYRSMISEEDVLTRGTLYWQLNDIWQAQTWSSVQWTGQWKILHYYMRRAYAPIMVSAYQTSDSIGVYVILDVINHKISYTLQINVISWKSDESLHLINQPSTNNGFSGVEVYHDTIANTLAGTSPKECYLILEVLTSEDGQEEEELLASNWHFPANFTEVDLPDPNITAANFVLRTEAGKNTITFQLTSIAAAPFVYMDCMNYNGVFSDNGFLLRPKNFMGISFTSDEMMTLESFESGLTIRSIKDTYTNKPYKI